jgi:hypothetical protein
VSVYRTPLAVPAPIAPKPHRFRIALVMGAVVAAHVGLLAIAFAMRSSEHPKKDKTEVVQVLVGHVDPSKPSEFEATGMFFARVTKRSPQPSGAMP